MRHASFVLGLASVLSFAVGTADAQSTLTFDGEVPPGAETHFFIPFEVPAGTVEIEVAHDDLSSENILDWGLEDPHGFRGWGGGNTEPAIVGIDRASRSYVPGPIAPGTWRVVVGKAQIRQTPANYHVVVTLRTTGTLAAQPSRQPYVEPAALASGWRWYAGDLHVHSRESGDAAPSLDEIAYVATERGLDFVAISDHNTHTALDFMNDVQSRNPAMLFVPSVEFTTYAGHANAFGATGWQDHRIGVEGATIAEAVAGYHAQGAFFSINHPSLDLGDLCIGCAWNQPLDEGSIDGIELQTTGQAIVTLSFLETNVARWDGYCERGHHVTPVGGSDDHRAGMGSGALDSPIGDPTTFVYASELSVDAILAGLKSGRTAVGLLGPTAPRVVLSSADLADGTDTIHRRTTRITVDVTGGVDQTLTILKNGIPYGEPITVDADPFHAELRVTGPSEGEDRYRAETAGPSRRTTITGNVYLAHVDVPRASGGCAVGSPNGRTEWSSAIAAVVFLLLGTTNARRRTRAR